MDPLHTPIQVAGATQPGRVVTVEDGAARLAAGPLPLCLPGGTIPPDPPCSRGAPAPRTARVGCVGERPGYRGRPRPGSAGSGPGPGGGRLPGGRGRRTPLTRRLVCEAARLEQGAVTLLVEDGSEDSGFEDRARTAVLSGRTDLVGRRQ